MPGTEESDPARREPRPGPGRVAELLADHHWDSTALGARESWDPVVAGVVDLMLASGVAMALCYGDDHLLLYNDPYAALLGEHHPGALVRPVAEVFADVWGSAGTAKTVVEVYRTGEPFVEVLKPPAADGVEPATGTFFTHSFSAVRDSGGRVAAVLAIVTDSMRTTESTRRLHDLRELTAALARAVTLDDVARVTMHHAMTAFGVDHVAVALDEARGWRAVRRTRGDTIDETDERLPPLWRRFSPDSPQPVIRAAASSRALFLSGAQLEAYRSEAADAQDRSLRALAALPLPGGRVRGAVSFGFGRPNDWLPEHRALLSAAVELIGQAANRAELYETQYGTSHLLQRSLLPHALPTVDSFRLAAQYRPGVDGNAAGGDFYDAFALPGDQLAVVLGDVAGHDVHAAALMGQVRAAVRAFAQTDPTPQSVLRNLDLLVDALSTGSPVEQTFVTVVYGVADGRSHRIALASAGHPPPLLRRCSAQGRASTAEAVPVVTGPPLGLGLGLEGEYATTVVDLGPGDTVLLFSDGVIERRGYDLADGIDALTAALAKAPTGDARNLAALLLSVVPGPTDDDVAVLALERAASPSRHASHDVPPDAQAPGRARRWLLQLLHTWDVPDELADTAALCLSELTTNALLHAGTQAHVEVDLTDERLLVTVTDSGERGTLTRAEVRGMSSRGRGLNLIDAVADAWGTEPVTHGTRVWYELLLGDR